tara:strand:- start:201 stop:1109 length:909 start_codon:yes stop_codon:yes gene_type:complete
MPPDIKDIDYKYTKVEDPSVVEEQVFMPSTLENIDFAVYDFLQDLNISTTTNEGFKPVPVSWVGAERAYNRKDRNWTDDETFIMKSDDLGAVIYPAITIERKGIVKDRTKRGKIFSPLDRARERGKSEIVIARRIAQDDTNKFATADAFRLSKDAEDKNFKRKNKKVVYETMTIPVPTYLEIEYEIECFTEYQQQMNDILAYLIDVTNNSNYLSVSRNNHSYECFVQSDLKVDNTISSLEEQERSFHVVMNIKVLGYINGAGPNEELPRITKTQNAVEVKIGRERVVLDIDNPTEKDSFYKS